MIHIHDFANTEYLVTPSFFSQSFLYLIFVCGFIPSPLHLQNGNIHFFSLFFGVYPKLHTVNFSRCLICLKCISLRLYPSGLHIQLFLFPSQYLVKNYMFKHIRYLVNPLPCTWCSFGKLESESFFLCISCMHYVNFVPLRLCIQIFHFQSLDLIKVCTFEHIRHAQWLLGVAWNRLFLVGSLGIILVLIKSIYSMVYIVNNVMRHGRGDLVGIIGVRECGVIYSEFVFLANTF